MKKKIYQKQNKSVGHQTNTCNARLLHIILGVILDPRSQRTGSYKIGAVIVNV